MVPISKYFELLWLMINGVDVNVTLVVEFNFAFSPAFGL